jgi:putative ABC transport system substrate-binding protein
MLHLQRREFITLLGGAAAWPAAARVQQSERVRRVGVLMSFAASDPDSQLRIGAFDKGMRDLGWIEGRNLHTEYRWARKTATGCATTRGSLFAWRPTSSW